MITRNDSRLAVFLKNDLTNLESTQTSTRILKANIFDDFQVKTSTLPTSNQSELNKINLASEPQNSSSSLSKSASITQKTLANNQLQNLSEYLQDLNAQQKQSIADQPHPEITLQEVDTPINALVDSNQDIEKQENNNLDITNQPNIVLIMVDDFGYEGIGAYGGTSYQTPVIDQLAQSGVRFNHAYSQPACTPSRVQLMTGMYNHRNYTHFAHMARNQTTFAHLLKEEGYATGVAGKWHLGTEVDSPQHFGFDESFVSHQIAEDTSVDTSSGRLLNPLLTLNGTKINYQNGEYGPDLMNEFLLEFIERNQSKPFFAYYPLTLVHDPLQPTPDSPDWGQQTRDSHDNKYFDENVKYMDKLVGNVVNKLDELQLRDNTLILFTSDNGTVRNIVSTVNGEQVVGGKNSTKDAGTHVPLIASWADVILEGSVRDDLIDFSDFLPTLADVGGAEVPQNLNIDGQSFLPQLLGQQGNPRQWSYGFWSKGTVKQVERFGGHSFEWVRNQHYKLYPNGEFYDIRNDVLETQPLTNLSAEQQRIRNMFQQVLDENDQFNGGMGNHLGNRMTADSGNNYILGLDGADTIFAGDGNDTILGGDDPDTIIGSLGNDILNGGLDCDRLEGGSGNDIYFVNNVGDQVLESVKNGIDSVFSNIHYRLANHLENLSLTGNNNLSGIGNNLENNLLGNSGDNFLKDHFGNDTLNGSAGNDTLIGSYGNDHLIGQSDRDLLQGGKGNDLLDGGTGDDLLRGHNGDDLIDAGDGNDRLNGGNGNDTLSGGLGADSFVYNSSTQGQDTITDYSVADDRLVIFRSAFDRSLSVGNLAAEHFTIGTSALMPAHRFIYDDTNGNLFFDRDGTGLLAQEHIATLSPNLPLTHQEFVLI